MSDQYDIIYLQVCEDEESEWLGEVTWCQDRVNNDDVKYIRADLAEQQLADVKTVSDHNLKVYQEAAEKLRQKLADSQQALRNVYEVWSLCYGIPDPVTVREKYLVKLIEQMRDAAKAGMK